MPDTCSILSFKIFYIDAFLYEKQKCVCGMSNYENIQNISFLIVSCLASRCHIITNKFLYTHFSARISSSYYRIHEKDNKDKKLDGVQHTFDTKQFIHATCGVCVWKIIIFDNCFAIHVVFRLCDTHKHNDVVVCC